MKLVIGILFIATLYFGWRLYTVEPPKEEVSIDAVMDAYRMGYKAGLQSVSYCEAEYVCDSIRVRSKMLAKWKD